MELVSLLPLVALLLALAWQGALAAHASWAAGTAARAGARAAAIGADATAAARQRLPDGLERGLTVRDKGDATVEVALVVPTAAEMSSTVVAANPFSSKSSSPLSRKSRRVICF